MMKIAGAEVEADEGVVAIVNPRNRLQAELFLHAGQHSYWVPGFHQVQACVFVEGSNLSL